MLWRCAVLVLSAAIVLGGAALPAAAVNISYDFTNCGAITPPPGTCPGDTGTPTLTYTVSGFPLTVNGFNSLGPGTPSNNLFIKTAGPGETGIGLSGQPQSEIQPNTFIELDTRKLPAGTGTLSIGSVQSGESFKVCLGDTSGTFGSANCSPVITGPFPPNDITSLSVPFNQSTDPFVDITAVGPHDDLPDDVLLLNATDEIPPVPEPSTLALLLTGAAGLGFARKQKK